MTLIYIKQSLNSPSNMMHGCRIVSRKGIDHITCILIFWFCLGFFFRLFSSFVCLFVYCEMELNYKNLPQISEIPAGFAFGFNK